MADVGLQSPQQGLAPRLSKIPNGWDFHDIAIFGRRTASLNFYKRLLMAVFGGLALVVPMVIMTIWETKSVCLSVTAACVALVAILLATIMVEAHPKDVLAVTATYAAVLVVFVGSSMASKS
jgi:cytochrome c biogenesis factor